MNLFESFILGIVQGMTEFIPISSTAHLLIGQKLMGIPADEVMFSFLVIVQLGTIVSLVIYFWHDLLRLVKAFFARPFSTPENSLGWYILIATIPALLAGYLLKEAVESLFQTPILEAAIRLLTAAILLTFAEWLTRKARHLDTMNWLDALVIGLFQVIAVFPGASRSGTTISAGMYRGFDRKSAARFAFLMSVPVMLAAGGYEILDVIQMPGLLSFLPVLALGFFSAALTGWIAIKWLLRFLTNHSLFIFAIYCALLGTICIIFSLV